MSRMCSRETCERHGASIRLNAELIDVRRKTLACGRSNTIETRATCSRSKVRLRRKSQINWESEFLPPRKRRSKRHQPRIPSHTTRTLRAKDLLYDISLSTRQKEDLFEAVQLLDQAVARDPSFFDAYCQLAGAHDRIYFLAFDHTDVRLQLSETVIQSIQRLHPERGETHLALAQHYYYAYRDYDRARQELVLAHLTLPNESRIPLLAGYIDRRQGRWEKSLEEMTQALDLNPRDFSVLQQIALTYEALGRYKEMAATLDRVLAMAPKDIQSQVRRALVDLENRADPKPFQRAIDAILADRRECSAWVC